jgi:hypothetical protein
MSQWRNEWIVDLQNRKLPLRERLLAFYLQYAGATYRPEWIRIYMYAGLADMDLNRNYLALVRKKLLVVMCDEFRHTFMPKAVAANLPPISAREIELLWTLHGGMFYWAIRRNIFNIKSVTPFETRTTDAIDLFLAGARELYPQVVAQTLAGTSGAGTAAAKAPRAKSKGVSGPVS